MNKTLWIILGVLVLAYLVGGCGGSKSKTGAIKFYKEGEVSEAGIMKAQIQDVSASAVELNELTSTFATWKVWSGISNLANYVPLYICYLLNGVAQDVTIDVQENDPENLFVITDLLDADDGMRAYITPNTLGKSGIVASYGGVVKNINVNVYPACQSNFNNYLTILANHYNLDEGYVLNNSNPVLQNNAGATSILKPHYLAGYFNGTNWDSIFASITTVSPPESGWENDPTDLLTYSGIEGTQNPIYVCDVDNGYVKVIKFHNVIIWKWIPKAVNPLEQVGFED